MKFENLKKSFYQKKKTTKIKSVFEISSWHDSWKHTLAVQKYSLINEKGQYYRKNNALKNKCVRKKLKK